ncbi:MAG: GNAT family N-acetyltransferase [Pseudomonadota bacterium]
MEDLAISLYPNSVPAFVEPELERLYGHIFSSLALHRIYGGITDGTSTYRATANGELSTIMLFRRQYNQVHVLNEQIEIHEQEIDRFVRYIFTALPSVTVITFNAIRASLQALAYPHQQFNCTEDIVLELPATVDAYLGSLGKSTRTNIKYYMGRLQRDFPSLRHDVYLGQDVTAEMISDIAALNRARMATKGKISSIDEQEAGRLIELARTHGLVSVITIDGRICAGTICFQVGANYFAPVSAHDARFDAYSLGILCWYRTICDCIGRGGKEFHFMWGRYAYKFLLMGVARDLKRIVIYRSRLHALTNCGMACGTAIAGYRRKLNLWQQDQARQKETSGMAFRFLHFLRRLNTMRRRF